MKKLYRFVCLFLLLSLKAQAQNVGIGTNTPVAKLHVKEGSVLAEGYGSFFEDQNLPTGIGNRMMWIASNGSFRAGFVNGNEWNYANIGSSSVAMGSTVEASGTTSVAIGSNNRALGVGTAALGNNNTAVFPFSFAAGDSSVTYGYRSVAAGYNLRAYAYAGNVIGLFNDTANAGSQNVIHPLNRIFQVGNGTANHARSNALTILQNGNTGIGISNPLRKLDLKGNASLNDSTLYFRSGSDNNHGLRYDATADGPYLFGFNGGALGAAGLPHSLIWDYNGNVAVRSQLVVDDANLNTGSVFGNALRFGNNSGEGIASKRDAGGNQNGLDFYTNYFNRMSITNTGNIGIGTSAPATPLQFANTGGNKIAFFQSGSNYYGIGTQASLLQIYTPTAADDIAFGYGNSTAFTENIRISGSGSLAVKTNLTVQNGKGIIRSVDGTQQKKQTKTIAVNLTITAGSTATFAFTFDEAFSGTPDVYVGNFLPGAINGAELILSVGNISSSGGTLFVSNPRSTSWSPNFSVKVIAIGPQ